MRSLRLGRGGYLVREGNWRGGGGRGDLMGRRRGGGGWRLVMTSRPDRKSVTVDNPHPASPIHLLFCLYRQ